MNALDNLLNQYRDKGETDLSRRDLVVFAMRLFKEVDELEQSNSGSPGKAAIEYLLNQKYIVVENPKLSRKTQDTMLSEIDAVINKVVAKYKIKRKGKNFYFDEAMSIAITCPDKIACEDADQLLARLYAAQQELEVLKIQMARTPLQNTSQTLLNKKAILDMELQIQDLKKKLRMLKYFDSLSDQNLLYRRSLGEAKKEVATGAAVGGAAGYTLGNKSFKKKVNYDKKRSDFQNSIKALNKEKNNMQGLAIDAKHLQDTGLTSNKTKKFDKVIDKMKKSTENQRALRKSIKSQGKKVVSLTREAIKQGMKSGAKGLAIGAAAGLGAAAIHKAKNESLSSKLYSHLNKLNRVAVNEDSEDLRDFASAGKVTKQLYKGLDGVYRAGKLSKYKGTLNVVRRNKGLKAASIAGALLLGAAGLSYIIQKAREKGPDKIKGSIRSTQSKARHSSTLTNKDKIAIQNNGNSAIQKINQLFKNNNTKRR